MSVKLDDALKIANMINLVFQDKNDISTLINAFNTNKPTLDELLSNLNADLNKDFNKVVKAIDDQTLLNEWAPISSTLNYIGDNIAKYHTILATVYKNASGDYKVISDGKKILFKDWCSGKGSQTTSVLDEMTSWLDSGTFVGGTNTYASLSSIFSNAGPGDTSSLGSDALGIWKKLIDAAQAYPNPTLLGELGYDTKFNSIIKFMESVGKLVTSVYYIHDSALQLLNKIDSSNSYVSVHSTLVSQFGNVDSPTSIWGKFSAELAPSIGNTHSFAEVKVSAFVPQNYPESLPKTAWPIKSWPAGTVYFGGTLDVMDTYPNKGFVSALKFHRAVPAAYSESDLIADNIGLQAIICKMNSDMSIEVLDLKYPSDNWYANQELWNLTGIDGQYPEFVSQYQINVAENFEANYPEPPTPPNNNSITVITGFKFITEDCDIAIALKYGFLDLENQQIDDSGVWTSPIYSGQSKIQAGSFEQMSGNYASGAFKPQIMSNAGWNTTDGKGGGPDNAISAQMASTSYKADIFQPGKVKKII